MFNILRVHDHRIRFGLYSLCLKHSSSPPLNDEGCHPSGLGLDVTALGGHSIAAISCNGIQHSPPLSAVLLAAVPTRGQPLSEIVNGIIPEIKQFISLKLHAD